VMKKLRIRFAGRTLSGTGNVFPQIGLLISMTFSASLVVATMPDSIKGPHENKDDPATKTNLMMTETNEVIRITLRGKPVLEYVKKEKPVPNGLAQHFRRSGYVHPVFSPGGQVVTGDFPLDHPHQHALFFAWTKAKFDGRNVEFWNQAKQLGTIEHRKVVDLNRQKDRVSFSVKHAFVVGKGEERRDALNETWTVTIYRTPNDYFLFDLKSVQTCATNKPLLLEKHHYGGMAFRGPSEWLLQKDAPDANPNGFQFLTSEGDDRLKGNHTRPNWVALGGKLAGRNASVAIFCHPENFRAPQHVRLHPSKPYFCFAPMVEGHFMIMPSDKYVSRYRYLVKSGPFDAKEIHRQWLRYAKVGK